MTDRTFEYEARTLRECAESDLAAFVLFEASAEKVATRHASQGDDSCIKLFQDHASHYSREHMDTPAESLFERTQLPLQPNDENTSSLVSYSLVGERLRNFVLNAVFVHSHNNAKRTPGRQHRVALNRFADLHVDQVLSSDLDWDNNDKKGRHLLWKEHDALWEYGAFDDDESLEELRGGNMGAVTSLSSSEMIRHVAANLAIGRGSLNKLSPKQKKKRAKFDDKAVYRDIKVPLEDPVVFEAPTADDPALDGVLLSVKESKRHKYNRKHAQQIDDSNVQETAAEEVVGYEPSSDFDTSLNWASLDNPDGVSIVHAAIDQGGCGSCWAFAAAGSLEASASRKAAYDAYTYFESEFYDSMANKTVRGEAIALAQQVERESIQVANLSIQELLDCDTTADQGCTGGNPLLAFYFIHRYGLTSWEEYPYVGFEDTCKSSLLKQPVATVKSWGIISPNHEKHMELALRYIGPVAVGVNGAKSSFLAYDGGIFDAHHCKEGANHALLVTGYGQEEAEDGSITKYWIARNSWGTGWGENGYVRVKRGTGAKGVPGVCGIARSPSVALGGMLVKKKTPAYVDASIRGASPSFAEDSEWQGLCSRMGFDATTPCGKAARWTEDHKAIALGVLGILCGMLALWPLTADIRRRRRRRRERDAKRREEQELLVEGQRPDEESSAMHDGPGQENSEASPLLAEGSSDHPPTYSA